MKIELGEDKFLLVINDRVSLFYRCTLDLFSDELTECFIRELDEYESNFVLKTIEHMKGLK